MGTDRAKRPSSSLASPKRRTNRAGSTSRSPTGLALLLVGAGLLHFVIPRFYERIVPRVLPAPDLLVRMSGLAEIATGLLVALPRTRRLGAWCAVVLLVAVWPANVQHTADNFPPVDTEGWVSIVRLPLQVPLIVWAARVARVGRVTGADDDGEARLRRGP